MSGAIAGGAGEVFVVGVAGLTLSAREASRLQRIRPGGIILFGRNVGEAGQLRELVAALRRAAPEALLMADAEGGRVDRLRSVAGAAPAAAELARRPPAWSARAGRWVGAALRHFDFDLDLAPVVDLDRGGRDNALDRRLLGATARAVTARARAFLRGLERSGVGGCVKHFPGLGGALFDTHHRMARIDLSRRELIRDLAPFRALAGEAGVVLLSHALYPAWDAGQRPATLSPEIATRLLRRDLGFGGVAVSDDLEMKALDAWGDLAERSVAAFVAGCDLLPICSRLEEVPAALAALEREARRSPSARRRLNASRRRIAAVRRAAARRRTRVTPLPLAAVVDRLERLRRAVDEGTALQRG